MWKKLFAVRSMLLVGAVLFVAGACESASEDSTVTIGEGDAVQTAEQTIDSDSAVDSVDAAPVEELDVASVDLSAPIPGTQEDLVQNVGDRVLFDYDSAVLTPEGRRTLERQAEWLRLFPEHSIMIEGHCDERGTREYNLALGERRSHAAREALIAFGIDPSRIKTTSYGKERPYALGHNKESWKLNRRAVSVVN